MKKLLSSLLLMLFFFEANAESDNSWSNLHEDLMYKGMPICPSDTPFVYIYYNNYPKIKLDSVCTNVQLDQETKEIFINNLVEEEGMRPILYHEGYRYCGSYKNKHVIITSFYEDRATGRFSTIGLISRDDDYIVNEGAILTGDRAHAGYMKLDWIKDNILQFRFIQPYRYLYHYLDSEELGKERYQELRDACDELGSTAISDAFYTIVQVNLDDPEYEFEYHGMAMAKRSHYEQFTDYERRQHPKEKCFNDLAMEYIDSDRQELDLIDSKQFAIQVLDCVNRSTRA